MSGGIGEARILLPSQIAKGAVISVRASVSHPMFTGMSRDAEGAIIPAFWVKDVTVDYGSERLAHFEWTSGISRDPFVALSVRATKEAPLTVTWTDTAGGVYTQSVDIKFTA